MGASTSTGGSPQQTGSGFTDYTAPLDALMTGLAANPEVHAQLRQDEWIAEGLRSLTFGIQERLGSKEIPSAPLKLVNGRWTAEFRIEEASRDSWLYGLGVLVVEAVSRETGEKTVLRSQEPLVGGGYPLSFERNGAMLSDNFGRAVAWRAGAGAEKEIIQFTQEMAELLQDRAAVQA